MCYNVGNELILGSLFKEGNKLKIAIIGSRGIKDLSLSKYLNSKLTEIVSGGAKGVDSIAKKYALENNIKLVEFLPEYEKYGKYAPIKRNENIVDYSDEILAFWDGTSRGTKYVIDYAKKIGKPILIIEIK